MSKKKQSKKNRKNKNHNRKKSIIKTLISSFVWVVILLVGEIIIRLPYIEDLINWIVKLLSFNYQ